MKIRNKSALFVFVLLLAAVLSACSNGNAAGQKPALLTTGDDQNVLSSRSTPGGSTSGLPQPCLEAAEVTEAVGFEVQVLREGTLSAGEAVICAYQATDTELGAFISIVVAPASESEQMLTEVRSAAKTFLGEDAEAETIDVGDGGYAYGSAHKSEAAAVAGARVYLVDISALGTASIGAKKDAMIEILTKVID